MTIYNCIKHGYLTMVQAIAIQNTVSSFNFKIDQKLHIEFELLINYCYITEMIVQITDKENIDNTLKIL